MGQLINFRNDIIMQSAFEITLDISKLNAGVYFVKTPIETKKLIIKHD